MPRDEARIVEVAAPQGEVEAALHQVHAPVVEFHFRNDERIAGDQPRHQRHEVPVPERVAGGDAHPAGRLGALGGDRVDREVERADGVARPLDERAALAGELQRPRTAVHQAHAERGFQPGHVLAHGGRRDAEAARCRRKTAVVRGLHEGEHRAHALGGIHQSK